NLAIYNRKRWELLTSQTPQTDDALLLSRLGQAMRDAGQAEVDSSIVYAGIPEREPRQLKEGLTRLACEGYTVDDELIRFSEFEWLIRALGLTLPPPSSASDVSAGALRAL